MKRFIRNFGMIIIFMQESWWLFWEGIFLKCHMQRAFDSCNHRFNIARQNLRLYERKTRNW